MESVTPVLKPYKLVSREFRGGNHSHVRIGDVTVGEKDIVLMSGPCSVESREQIVEIAKEVQKAGGRILRGGAFKPRTSPYAFQGLGLEGLKLLAEAREATGLPVITEIMDTKHLEMVEQYADCLQVGARNMQNFSLLKEVGRSRLPVMLKRGMSATIKDLLMSAEYILAEGNFKVLLCERGIRTFETYTRNTLDLNAVPVLKKETHLPVVVDPTHGIGLREHVATMAVAAVAAGADAIMTEVHNSPELAKSDGEQAHSCPTNSRTSWPASAKSPKRSGGRCRSRPVRLSDDERAWIHVKMFSERASMSSSNLTFPAENHRTE